MTICDGRLTRFGTVWHCLFKRLFCTIRSSLRRLSHSQSIHFVHRAPVAALRFRLIALSPRCCRFVFLLHSVRISDLWTFSMKLNFLRPHCDSTALRVSIWNFQFEILGRNSFLTKLKRIISFATFLPAVVWPITMEFLENAVVESFSLSSFAKALIKFVIQKTNLPAQSITHHGTRVSGLLSNVWVHNGRKREIVSVAQRSTLWTKIDWQEHVVKFTNGDILDAFSMHSRWS